MKDNSPAILAGGAVVGVVGTAYLTGRASFKAAHQLAETSPAPETLKEKTRHVWRHYIPAGICGVVTIACVVGSTKIGHRKFLAAAAAYSVTEQAYSQYKEKVVEQLGENKERAIRDEIAKDNVLKNPPKPGLVVSGKGVVCCEEYTMRYFESDMESLRHAENQLNAKLLRHDVANLDDFYYLVGLSPTQYSADIGWMSSRLMELAFRSVLMEDGRPCLAFSYNYVRPLD